MSVAVGCHSCCRQSVSHSLFVVAPVVTVAMTLPVAAVGWLAGCLAGAVLVLLLLLLRPPLLLLLLLLGPLVLWLLQLAMLLFAADAIC